jgi:hypothetical protein
MMECVITRLDKAAIVRVLRDEPKFSEAFMALGKPALKKIWSISFSIRAKSGSHVSFCFSRIMEKKVVRPSYRLP